MTFRLSPKAAQSNKSSLFDSAIYLRGNHVKKLRDPIVFLHWNWKYGNTTVLYLDVPPTNKSPIPDKCFSKILDEAH